MDKFNLREYLKNNPLLKENIEFPELEDEFEGAMDAMVVEPEIYLQDIIDDPSVVLGDDYFEVYNAVEDGIYSEDEAVELAKKWATDKLSSLAENKTLNELELDFYDEDDPNAVTLTAQSGEYDGDVEDGMVSFSVYDEYEEFDEDNWEDILGSNHAFYQISNKIPTKVEADGDYVQITVKIDDLKGIAK